jgi:hypothetical protein
MVEALRRGLHPTHSGPNIVDALIDANLFDDKGGERSSSLLAAARIGRAGFSTSKAGENGQKHQPPARRSTADRHPDIRFGCRHLVLQPR